VNSYTVNDALTGKFSFKATGHSFQPIPCVDGNGVPIADQTPTSCLPDDARRSFKACVGCHLSETAARSARAVAKLRLTNLAAEVDALVAKAPASEKNAPDRISTAEGCAFNSGLAKERGSPIHNPFLIEALLLACRTQLVNEYGLTIQTELSMRPTLTPPPRVRSK
jgi:hypothetical protein